MATLRLASVLITLVATALAVVLGLTTYTLPNHASAPYVGIRDLITTTLHDSQPQLPPYGGQLGRLAAGVAPTDTAAAVSPETAPRGPAVSEAAERWAALAARSDSAALRAWLGALVLATATTEGDTTRIVLRRLGLERGCPWFSALHGVYANDGGYNLRLLRVTADCPPGASAQSSPTSPEHPDR